MSISSTPASLDSFKCSKTLEAGGKTYVYYSLPEAEKNGLDGHFEAALFDEGSAREPAAQRGRPHPSRKERHRCLLEMAGEQAQAREAKSRFRPARVLMQDFTGVPAVVDLAAMRNGMQALEAAIPRRSTRWSRSIWSSTTRSSSNDFGEPQGLRQERRAEEYKQQQASATIFLKWGQRRVREFLASCRPAPASAIRCNLEYLAPDRLDREAEDDGRQKTGTFDARLSGYAGRHRQPHHHGQRPRRARLGRRRHRGGSRHARPAAVDAAARRGRLQARRAHSGKASPPPTSCSPSPRCCARRAWSASSWNSTAPASTSMSVADKATIGNMAPEYGATCGFFPVDAATHRLSRKSSGRKSARVALVAAYAKAQGLYRTAKSPAIRCSPKR